MAEPEFVQLTTYSSEFNAAFHGPLAQRVIDGSNPFAMQLVDGCDFDDIGGFVTELAARLDERGSELAVMSVDNLLGSSRLKTPFIALVGFDLLVDRPDLGSILGNLRSRAMKLVEDGTKIAFVVTVDLELLRHFDGSSILVDSKPVHLDREERNRRSKSIPLPQLSADLGAGFSTLTAATGLVLRDSDADVKPHVAMRRRTRVVARHLGAESGVRLLAEIERAETIGHASTERVLSQVGGDALWTLYCALFESSPSEASQIHRVVSEEVNSHSHCPADVSAGFKELWGIERVLRRVLVDDCARLNQEPADLIARCKLMELAQGRASRSQRIRDGSDLPANPVEWLTLDELLQVILSQDSIGREYPGLRAALPDLRRDVVPARNALVHFRSVDGDTLRRISSWYPILLRITRATGISVPP